MYEIIIYKEKNVDVDIDGTIFYLNNLCKYVKFINGKSLFAIKENIIEPPQSYQNLSPKIIDESKGKKIVFLLTEKPYYNNYFFMSYRNYYIISFFGWTKLTNLSRNNGLVYFIADILALKIENTFRHQEKTGCIYDFLWMKTGIDDGMRQAYFCFKCLARLGKLGLNDLQKGIMSDLKVFMNDLSAASKWNQNIIDYWKSKPNDENKKNVVKKSSSVILRRKAIKKKEINILIASPSDADVERDMLMNKLETKFRRDNYEKLCGRRIIVHGWEELASQPGYAQDIINNLLLRKVDIVIAVFKHKLGTPTINPTTKKTRALSGTVEELLFALDNDSNNLPLGMAYFFSKAPNPSFDSPDLNKLLDEWNRLKIFKESVKNKILYKPYTDTDDLLNTICKDLEKNINHYFNNRT